MDSNQEFLFRLDRLQRTFNCAAFTSWKATTDDGDDLPIREKVQSWHASTGMLHITWQSIADSGLVLFFRGGDEWAQAFSKDRLSLPRQSQSISVANLAWEITLRHDTDIGNAI